MKYHYITKNISGGIEAKSMKKAVKKAAKLIYGYENFIMSKDKVVQAHIPSFSVYKGKHPKHD